MNDFDYEVMQKKRVSAGARGRKCGSKSKKCGLPSDHLTAKQLREKNGDVQAWNLNEPMVYATFKRMPADLQAEYLRVLNSRFSVGIATISKELFHKTDAALRGHLKNHGISVDIRGKNRLSRAERMVWENWLAEEHVEEEVVEETAVEETTTEEETAEQHITQNAPIDIEEFFPKNPFEMSSLAATFEGEFNATKFIGWLAQLPIPAGNVTIRVEVTKNREEKSNV